MPSSPISPNPPRSRRNEPQRKPASVTLSSGAARDLQATGAPVPGARLDIPLLRQDRRLWAWWHRGQSRRLVVVFSSVGHAPDTPPVLEFAKSATAGGRDSALFLADPQRSWLNAPHLVDEMAEAIEAAREETGAEETVALGYSLGGFAALVLSGFTRFGATLAFSPQISIDPALVPDEGRWRRYRQRIPALRIRSAADHMSPDTRHCIIMGASRLEKPQLRLIPQTANVDLHLLPRTHHDTATRIKKAGLLPQVMDLAFAGQRDALSALLAERLNARSKGQDA